MTILDELDTYEVQSLSSTEYTGTTLSSAHHSTDFMDDYQKQHYHSFPSENALNEDTESSPIPLHQEHLGNSVSIQSAIIPRLQPANIPSLAVYKQDNNSINDYTALHLFIY